MKSAVGAINRFKDFEETEDSFNCCKIFLTVLLFLAVGVTFAGNFLYYLNNPFVYIDVLKEEPTLDNVADYNCDCTYPVQRFNEFVDWEYDDIFVCGDLDPIYGLSATGFYFDYLVCTGASSSFSSLMKYGKLSNSRYLNYGEMESLILNEWKTAIERSMTTVRIMLSLELSFVENFYDLQKPEANPNGIFPGITNGFPEHQWENIVRPFMWNKFDVNSEHLDSETWDIVNSQIDIVSQFFTYTEVYYFDACLPTNCQRTLTNSVFDQLLDSLSFAGGLLPLYTVILTLFYAITAKCCRGILTPCYRTIKRPTPGSGSGVELKTPQV